MDEEMYFLCLSLEEIALSRQYSTCLPYLPIGTVFINCAVSEMGWKWIVPEISQNRPDAVSIGTILAYFKHNLVCLYGMWCFYKDNLCANAVINDIWNEFQALTTLTKIFLPNGQADRWIHAYLRKIYLGLVIPLNRKISEKIKKFRNIKLPLGWPDTWNFWCGDFLFFQFD